MLKHLMHTLIFVSLENWDDIWRRNQFVCAELARRYPDMQILFVCPPRDVSNAIRTRRLGSLRGPNNWHPEGFPNITVTKPLKLLPSTLAVGRWVNDFMVRVHVRGMLRIMDEQKLGVRSWKLEDDDEGGFTTKTQRHEEAGEDPQIAQITQINDDGTEVTGDRGQGTGEELGVRSWKLEDDDGVRGQKLEVRSEELEEGTNRQEEPAEQNESEALPKHSNSYLPTPSSPSSGATEITEADNPQISRISQITGLAGQPAGRGPAAAEQNESAALPQHSNSYLPTPNSSLSGVMLWLNPHDAVHMVGRMGETRAIYDITDDWTQFTHFTDRKALLDRTIAEDALLCRKADAVIVCSKSLYESRKSLARDIHLIPNGVDAAHYRCVLDDHGPLPGACQGWPRPVFGYTGSIHGDRVDVKLVEAMTVAMKAKNMPGTLVLIGPVMLPMQDRQRLEATGRVIFTGPIAYRDLPQYMRAFDVCIVPHCMTAFVESLNPIKLWEYLAAGKPIVSTDVAGFRDYPHLVRTARTADEFLTQCQAAVAEGTEKSELRRAEAGKHSWRSRVDEIVTVLGQARAQRSGERNGPLQRP